MLFKPEPSNALLSACDKISGNAVFRPQAVSARLPPLKTLLRLWRCSDEISNYVGWRKSRVMSGRREIACQSRGPYHFRLGHRRSGAAWRASINFTAAIHARTLYIARHAGSRKPAIARRHLTSHQYDTDSRSFDSNRYTRCGTVVGDFRKSNDSIDFEVIKGFSFLIDISPKAWLVW